MVWLLARWGYYVTFRAPLVLQAEAAFDARALMLSRAEADKVRRYAVEHITRDLTDAIAESDYIEWIVSEDIERMQQRLRGRLQFYPVLR
jgi:hypothetical protein